MKNCTLKAICQFALNVVNPFWKSCLRRGNIILKRSRRGLKWKHKSSWCSCSSSKRLFDFVTLSNSWSMSSTSICRVITFETWVELFVSLRNSNFMKLKILKILLPKLGKYICKLRLKLKKLIIAPSLSTTFLVYSTTSFSKTF